jgi:hypothetical protein
LTSDGINSGDSDLAFLDQILSANSVAAVKSHSVAAVKVSKNPMDDCPVCDKASRKNCFKCMESFYNHMHDPITLGRLFMPQQREV